MGPEARGLALILAACQAGLGWERGRVHRALTSPPAQNETDLILDKGELVSGAGRKRAGWAWVLHGVGWAGLDSSAHILFGRGLRMQLLANRQASGPRHGWFQTCPQYRMGSRGVAAIASVLCSHPE